MSTDFSCLFRAEDRSRKSIYKCLKRVELYIGLVPYYKYNVVLTHLLPKGEEMPWEFLLEDFFTFLLTSVFKRV